MSAPTPPEWPDADRNLLFGVIALQVDLLGVEQFVEACTLWAARKSTPLADLLVERGWLSPADRADVERLVRRKLGNHDQDARASLNAALGPGARAALARIDDDAVRASVAATPPAAPAAPSATGPYTAPTRARYRLDRLHAAGGIGQVWVAHDGQLGRDVALKELRPDWERSPAYAERFIREAQITSQLEHPGIVPVYELSQRPEDGRPFYVMRFVRGQTLTHAIQAYHARRRQGKAGAVEFRALVQAVVALCQAAAYAHARGVLHRDLKGQNVVLGDYGEVVLLDWGLAKLRGQSEPAADAAPVRLGPGAADRTQPGEVLGTPAYMAPEQAEGRLDRIDERTDVYGLGAILYEVLTGQPPYTGEDRNEVLRRVRDEEPAPPRALCRDAPPALEAVCLRALAWLPQDRYASATELAAELQSWLADEPVRAYPEPAAGRALRWGRRHRPLVAGAAALLLTAAVALGVSTALVGHQKALAESNFRDAQEQRRLAEREAAATLVARRRAEANLRKARGAVDALLTRVSEEEGFLAHEPRMERLRRKLLGEALAFYRGLLEDNADDPDVRRETAHAHRRMADVLQDLGDHAAAEREYRAAADLSRRLAAAFPGDPRDEQELAAVANSLGALYRTTGRLGEARTALTEALERKEKLAAAYPEETAYQQELANTLHNLSEVLADLGLSEEAEAASQGAVGRSRDLAGRPGATPELRRQYVKDLIARSNLLDHAGRVDDQEKVLRQALGLARELVRAEGPSPGRREDLALCHNNLGILLRKRRALGEAEKHLGEALALRAQLAKDFPAVPDYQNDLASTHRSLALLRLQQGQIDKGRAELDAALAIQKPLVAAFGHVPAYRRNLAISWLNLGLLRHALREPAGSEEAFREAKALWEQLTREGPEVPEYESELASALQRLGLLLAERDGLAAGLPHWREAARHERAALAKSPHHARYQQALRGHYQAQAAALQSTKDAAGLAALAREWHQALPEGKDAYLEARLLAGAVRLARADDKGRHGAKEVEGWAGEAVRLLEEAGRKGAADAPALRRDPALAPLRGREDFGRLLAELEKAARPREK
jgi:serine/threonine-protein kinase